MGFGSAEKRKSSVVDKMSKSLYFFGFYLFEQMVFNIFWFVFESCNRFYYNYIRKCIFSCILILCRLRSTLKLQEIKKNANHMKNYVWVDGIPFIFVQAVQTEMAHYLVTIPSHHTSEIKWEKCWFPPSHSCTSHLHIDENRLVVCARVWMRLDVFWQIYLSSLARFMYLCCLLPAL